MSQTKINQFDERDKTEFNFKNFRTREMGEKVVVDIHKAVR